MTIGVDARACIDGHDPPVVTVQMAEPGAGRDAVIATALHFDLLPQGDGVMPHEDPELIARRLTGLRTEHRDLDQAIVRLERDRTLDQLQITRMKKRRLHIKDAITRLESDLIPDLDA